MRPRALVPLRARGLGLVRHFWHMRIDLPAELDAGRPPEGIAIRKPDVPHDLRGVHAVLDRAFADHWDYHRYLFEHWLEDNAEGPAYDPDLWLVAWDEGRPVGALTAVGAGRERVGESAGCARRSPAAADRGRASP